MSSIICEHEIAAVLTLESPRQDRFSREIRDGERLFVGTDENSDICLTDDNVAATHCVIIADGGCVTVQDCYSKTGTFVDERKIREVQLTANSEVQVGATVIAVTLNSRRSKHTLTERTSSADSRVRHERDTVVAEVAGTSADSRPASEASATSATANAAPDAQPTLNADSVVQTIRDLKWQLEQALAENEVLHDRLAAIGTTTTDSQNDPFQEEMVALLRAEVMELQAALAEREQVSATPSHQRSLQCSGDEAFSEDDTAKLVERLEELLLELQERDEQIATLTELLEADEAANRAERDERTQLDSWLKDIEDRFGCREQEWQAEKSRLQADLGSMAADRDRAEAAINADSSNAKLEATQKVLVSLRDTAESQRLQLLESEQTILQLRREVELARHSQPREELVRLAEERAEIARQRQELEASRQHDHRAGANEATLKLQVLRQHLKEIHQQERKEQEERKLSSRLARLWSRLDSR